MNFSSDKKILTLASLILFGVSLTKVQAQSLWASDVQAGVNLSRYSNTTAKGGVGFHFGVKQSYFFNQYVGAFLGVDFLTQRMQPISTEENEHFPFIDVPLGLSLRPTLFGADRVVDTNLDLGFFGSFTVFKSNVAAAGASNISEVQSGFGFYGALNFLFSLPGGFAVGPQAALKVKFNSPLKDIEGAKLTNYMLGVSGRYYY